MLSRLIVRAVLAVIIGLLLWVVGLTWSVNFENNAQRVALSLIEGGVLLAALSLLIESFLSFGNITVKKGSFRDVFFAFSLFDEREKSVVSVRTCELFALRSVVLALMSLVAAAGCVLLWEGVKFLLNPHALTVNWNEVFKMVPLFFGALFTGLLLIGGNNFITKKIAGKHFAVRAVALGSYWIVSTSLVFGILLATTASDKVLAGMPLYLAILYATGITFLMFSSLGIILALGYGLFKLAGKAILGLSGRFPVLGEVWNQICPLQTIHFVK